MDMHPSPAQPAPSMDAAELELALAQRAIAGDGFEAAVREAVEAVGGVMLFHIRLDDGDDTRQVAAAAIGDAMLREIVIVDLPGGGGPVTVSQASDSALPIAAIAPAYAGLAACWPRAA